MGLAIWTDDLTPLSDFSFPASYVHVTTFELSHELSSQQLADLIDFPEPSHLLFISSSYRVLSLFTQSSKLPKQPTQNKHPTQNQHPAQNEPST